MSTREPGPDAPRLPADVAREIDQVAHFGKASAVKHAVLQAGERFGEREYDKAVEVLLPAKTDAPRSPMVRELLGLAYYHQGMWREAARELAAYRRLSGERDQDPPLADAERALGRPEKALGTLEGLEDEGVSEGTLIEGLIVRASALRDLGRPGEAVAALQRGPVRPAQIRHEHLRLWYALADALEEAGDRRSARGWWDAIYAEDAEFFDVASRRLGVKKG